MSREDCGGDCGRCARCQQGERDYYERAEAERLAAAYDAERAEFEANPLAYLAETGGFPDDDDVPF